MTVVVKMNITQNTKVAHARAKIKMVRTHVKILLSEDQHVKCAIS